MAQLLKRNYLKINKLVLRICINKIPTFLVLTTFGEDSKLKGWVKIKTMSNTTNDKGQNKQDFNVYSVNYHNEGSKNTYCHWSDGLVMYIEKNGVSVKLEGDEIIQLVNALPRTIGGAY